VASIDVGCLCPSRPLGLPRLHQHSRLAGRLLPLELSLASCQGLLGFHQCLLRVAPALAHSKRIALHERMDDREDIGHAQTCQPLVRQLHQGRGSGTDPIEPRGAKGLEPLLSQRLPRGIGPIVPPPLPAGESP